MSYNKQILVNDITLNYYEAGEGEIVLLLHGNSQDSLIFKQIFHQLSKSFHVFAIDSRGHGLSETGNIPYTIQQYAEDILVFCRLKKMKHIRVIGYSDGANVALYLNHIAPWLIVKSVCISGNYEVQGIKKWFRFCLFLLSTLIRIPACFNEKMKYQQWKLNLMRKDIGLESSDFYNMSQPILLISADNDLIYEAHPLKLHNCLVNSKAVIIGDSNHFNILRKKQVHSLLESFLEEI